MLNAKQRKFVAEYIKDCNVTRAATVAGFSAKTACAAGSRLLRNPEVRSAIQKKLEKYDITPERVLAEIAKLGYSNMDDFVESDGETLRLALTKTTRDQRACISELTEDTTGGSGDGERRLVLRTKVKLHDKTKNLELLGRHLKLFTDRVEHTGLEGLADRLNQVRNKKHASDGA